MKFLKKSQLNFRNVKDKSVSVETDGRVTMDGNLSLSIPKGNTATRPVPAIEGMIRYNTTENEFEFYQGNGLLNSAAWRKVKFKEPTTISFQSFENHGGGDTFGPLNVNPCNFIKEGSNNLITTLEAAQRLLVIVENVIQVANVNYEITLTPPTGSPAGAYIHFGSNVPTSKNIYVINGFDR